MALTNNSLAVRGAFFAGALLCAQPAWSATPLEFDASIYVGTSYTDNAQHELEGPGKYSNLVYDIFPQFSLSRESERWTAAFDYRLQAIFSNEITEDFQDLLDDLNGIIMATCGE